MSIIEAPCSLYESIRNPIECFTNFDMQMCSSCLSLHLAVSCASPNPPAISRHACLLYRRCILASNNIMHSSCLTTKESCIGPPSALASSSSPKVHARSAPEFRRRLVKNPDIMTCCLHAIQKKGFTTHRNPRAAGPNALPLTPRLSSCACVLGRTSCSNAV